MSSSALSDMLGMQQLLTRREVTEITGMSKTTVYELIDRDDFPRPVRIAKRSVRWRVADVQGWLDSRPAA